MSWTPGFSVPYPNADDDEDGGGGGGEGGAVDSVNGYTGAVVLDAVDVGAETAAGAQAKADAKVAQTITNGTTTSAPSQDAVFDALALKAPTANPTFTGTVTIPDASLAIADTSGLQTALNAKADDSAVVHDTGDETIAGVKTFSSDPIIPDEAYGSGWNGVLEPATKNALYDKIETLGTGVSSEDVQDIVGAMVVGGTETGIAVTYDDTNARLDFVAEVTQAELDAKVTQTITNGATTTAPSEDAVFDALALKANAANAVFTGTVTIPDNALAIADTNGLQTALDAKAPSANPTFTGTVTVPDGALAIADTNGLQTALDAKADESALEALDDTVDALPELVADDAGEVDLATAGGVTTLTLTSAISRVTKVVNDQTTNYTLAATDADTIIRMTSASARTITFPQDSDVALPVGSMGWIVSGDAGDVTMVQGTGASLVGEEFASLYNAGDQARWFKTAANTFYVESITGQIIGAFTFHTGIYNHDNIAASMSIHNDRLDKIVGQYYTTSHGLTSVSDTPSLNRLMYVPHMLAAGTIDTLTVDCQASQASSTARVGIYGTTSGLPGSLIAEFTTGAQLDLSTTGMKVASGTAVIPTSGLYWFACVIQGSAISTVRLRQVQDGPYGINMPLGTSAPTSAGALLAMRTESASGALPSTATVVAGGGVNAQPIRMFYKYSA